MAFIADTLARIRLFADEPSTNAKYSDTEILDLIQSAWGTILEEINRNTQSPLVVRHSITFSPNQEMYVLPPTIQNIIRLAKFNALTGAVEWEIRPASRYNPAGPGILFEGNVIRLQPKWTGAAESLSLEYIPNGDVKLHNGTAGTITNDDSTDFDCTVVLAASPTTGILDTRPNAYGGSVLRILSATSNDYVQERIISEYDVTTRTATLVPHFESGLLPGGTVTYEIAPLLYQAQDIVVALAVARDIAMIEGEVAREKSLTRKYTEKMRNLRLNVSAYEKIVGMRFQHDVRNNTRFLDW